MFDSIENGENAYECPLLDIIMTALHAKWYVPDEAPDMGLPPGFDRDALCALEIQEVDGGYAAIVCFDVSSGQNNAMGLPYERRLPTYREAFLEGARMVCAIVTGSTDLPFSVIGDELMVVSVTSSGLPLMMRRSIPTQDD